MDGSAGDIDEVAGANLVGGFRRHRLRAATIRSAMALASARRPLSTNSRTPNSQTWLSHPGSLYHQTMPAFSSSPAISLAVSRVYWPRWTVVTRSLLGFMDPLSCAGGIAADPTAPTDRSPRPRTQIGRASCRERV